MITGDNTATDFVWCVPVSSPSTRPDSTLSVNSDVVLERNADISQRLNAINIGELVQHLYAAGHASSSVNF
jgi:hypothetical protein